jgi:hypothetical protein
VRPANTELSAEEISKRALKRSMAYIPAETRVAEWIRADAGTGASIESGNQKWKPNCADLQKEATIRQSRRREA